MDLRDLSPRLDLFLKISTWLKEQFHIKLRHLCNLYSLCNVRRTSFLGPWSRILDLVVLAI